VQNVMLRARMALAAAGFFALLVISPPLVPFTMSD